MATRKVFSEFVSKNRIIVYGYIRSNFVDNCWINEIIQIIIQFYVSKGGSLYMFGRGESGCLGIKGYENKPCKTPTLCPPFDQHNTLDVSVGCQTFILDIYGDVWSCGKMGNGQTVVESVTTPKKLNLIQSVIQVAAGGEHSLILLKNGHVQSFGRGTSGQLGHGNNENLAIPKTIDSLKKIIRIVAGYLHSICLSENGDLFCFGDNDYGQCGVGADKDDVLSPTKIGFDKEVVLIECGDEVTLLITSNGRIYSFGKGEYGQLGHGDESNEFTPTLIETLQDKKITRCSTGEFHSICIDNEGIVWSFGANVYGQCGLPLDVEQQLTPKVIEFFVSNKIKAIDCAAGDNHSCVISEDGSLYVFGNNGKTQLGLGLGLANECYCRPRELSFFKEMPVKKVSMGFDYTAVITE